MNPAIKYLLFILLTFCFAVVYGKKFDYTVISSRDDVAIRNKTLYTRTELLIQINSKEGEHAAEFTLYYSPGRKLSKLAAWVQDTTGKVIRKLERKQITDRSAFLYGTFYSDYMVRSFEIKHNQYPYQVHVEYCIEEPEFFDISNWSPVEDAAVPVLHATLTLETPLNYPVKIFRRRIDPPVVDSTGKTIRYTWNSSYTHLIKPETCSQSLKDLLPLVSVVPVEFEYGIRGSFATWATFGDYMEGLMQDGEKLPVSETNTVKALIAGAGDTLAMIRKLYLYLQDNTRYLNVTIDIGGLKPYPASYAAQNKYGDCKALSLYMKSLLAAAGIRSFFTLVWGAEIPRTIIADFPSQQFNHAILCVPVKSDTLWLDCTAKELPAGYTSFFIQGRPALVVSRGKSKLVNIPCMNPEDVEVCRVFNYASPVNEAMQVNLHANYKGAEFEEIAYLGSFAAREEKLEFVRKFIPGNNYELVDFSFTRKSSDKPEIVINARLTTKDELKTLNDRMIFTPPAVDIPAFGKITSRELPVYFPFPVWCHDTIRMAIPEGMSVKLYPAVELSCEMGTYRVASHGEQNMLVYNRDILIRRGMIPLENYPALYTWIGSIRAFERQNKLIFTSTHE